MNAIKNNILIYFINLSIMVNSLFIKVLFLFRFFKRSTKEIFVNPPIRSLIPNDYQWTTVFPSTKEQPEIPKLRSWTIMEHHCAVQSWRMNGHFNEELYKQFLLLRYQAIGSTIK